MLVIMLLVLLMMFLCLCWFYAIFLYILMLHKAGNPSQGTKIKDRVCWCVWNVFCVFKVKAGCCCWLAGWLVCWWCGWYGMARQNVYITYIHTMLKHSYSINGLVSFPIVMMVVWWRVKKKGNWKCGNIKIYVGLFGTQTKFYPQWK